MANWVLYEGEASQVMRDKIAADSVDLTVTSPPYDDLREYGGYTFPFEEIASQLFRVTAPGGVLVWIVADQTINGSETGTSFRQALHFKEIGFSLHDTMIYQVSGTGAKGSNLAYWSSFEYMFIFTKGGRPKTFNPLEDRENKTAGSSWNTSRRKANGKFKKREEYKTGETSRRSNVWTYNVGFLEATDPYARLHPATFPEALAGDHIRSWSNPGDLVLDPFSGSGTTGKQSIINGRDFIGIDISGEYIETSRLRLTWAEKGIPFPDKVQIPGRPQFYQESLF